MRAVAIVLAMLAAEASAQDGPNLAAHGAGDPGGVAQLVLAHRLYQQGIDRRDAVDAMTAARLAREVKLSALMAPMTTEAVEGVPQGTKKAGAPGPVTVAGMLAAARALAGNDEILLTLLDRIEAEPLDGRITATSAESTLPAGQRDRWSLAFFGVARAEVGLVGDGDSNLDLEITDDTGATVCLAAGPDDIAYCDFVPARNGTFMVTVTNLGEGENSYRLLRN